MEDEGIMGSTVFSTNLQALRKKKGVTQEQLANYLGVSPQAVSKWENGSYPEGDLLPRISEYFEVSISYLYGQEKEKVSTEQMVLNDLMDIYSKAATNDEIHKKYFEKIFNIAWAFQIGAWKNNKTYYHRGTPDDDIRTASVLSLNSGISFYNLNRNKEFVLMANEPEEGFAKTLEITEDGRKFFALLGKPGALEIIHFLLSLNNGEFVTAATIAKNVGLDIDKTKELLKEAGRFQMHPNSHFVCVNIIGTDDDEVAYGINSSSVGLYVGLMLVADQLICPPYGYQMQINSREKSYMKREDIVASFKKKKQDGIEDGTV